MIFTTVIFAALLAGALLFIVAPLFASRPRKARLAGRAHEDLRDGLLREKEAALHLLRDLDFDLRTGKMLEADYNSSRAEAEARAMEVIRQLDALGEPREPWDEELEEEIRNVRRRMRAEIGHAAR